MGDAPAPPGGGAPAGGLAVIDKPAGLTSHQVVARLRRLLRTKKVGHAGTLDPMATGVLLCGVGAATRLLGHLALTDKAYDATIRLGETTVTDDAEGELVAGADTAGVSEDAIRTGIAHLTGPIEQVPSDVSAIKVGGVRSYARVRAGEAVELAARSVTVSSFAVHRITRGTAGRPADEVGTAPTGAARGTPAGRQVIDLDVSVTCSTGTYVRALARDLGAGLGVGGHLTALRRTRVGPYLLADATALTEDTDQVPVTPLDDVARRAFEVIELGPAEAAGLRHGRPIPPPGGAGVVAAFDGAQFVALVGPDGRPVAVFAPA